MVLVIHWTHRKYFNRFWVHIGAMMGLDGDCVDIVIHQMD